MVSPRARRLLALAGFAALPAALSCQVNARDATGEPRPTAAPTVPAAPPPAPPPSAAPAEIASAAPTATAAEVAPPPPDPCGGPVPAMACIPGGDFLRGSREGEKNEQPQATVWVDAFLMDVTEVTVEAFEACVAAGKCKSVRTIYNDFSRPRQPKVGVSWYDTVNYCKAMNKHLPTEAEWEKAARGADGRRYPWGNEAATCELAVIQDKRGRSCGVKQATNEPDKGRTFEVATRAPNQFGLYDMSGNAWEWVFDYYSTSYGACGEACLGKNPKGPCGGAEPCLGHGDRVVRGGSWYWDASYATTTYRRHHIPANNPYHHYGFRCAASLEEAAALRAH